MPCVLVVVVAVFDLGLPLVVGPCVVVFGPCVVADGPCVVIVGALAAGVV